MYKLTIWRKAGKTTKFFSNEAAADKYIANMAAADYANATAFYIERV